MFELMGLNSKDTYDTKKKMKHFSLTIIKTIPRTRKAQIFIEIVKYFLFIMYD